LDDAIEIDVDAVYDGETAVVCGIIEHIERAGVHSGDSSFMLPSQTLSDEMIEEIEASTKALLRDCRVRGLMNVQYAVRQGRVHVLEVNPRASRSVPFVSKVVGVPWAKVAARVMAGETLKDLDKLGIYGPILNFTDYRKAISKIKYKAVKESVFPFIKFPGVDAILGPEMKSTGEVMGIEYSLAEAFSRAQKASSNPLPMSGKVFVSVKESDKEKVVPYVKELVDLGFSIIATLGTAKLLNDNGIKVQVINKVRDGSPHIVEEIELGRIDMVINTPEGSGTMLDSRTIRSSSIQARIPLFTTLQAVEVALDAMKLQGAGGSKDVRTIQEYLAEI
jgi:carbamoyl-phosphate synthase large subunit